MDRTAIYRRHTMEKNIRDEELLYTKPLLGDYEAKTTPLVFLAFSWVTNGTYFPVRHMDGSVRNLSFQPFCFHNAATPRRIPVDFNHSAIVGNLFATVWSTETHLFGSIEFPDTHTAGSVITAISDGEFNAISPTHSVLAGEDVTADNGETVTLVDSAAISVIALVKESANTHEDCRLWVQGFDFREQDQSHCFKDYNFGVLWDKYFNAFMADPIRKTSADGIILRNS